MYRYFYILCILWPLVVPIGSILGIVSSFYYFARYRTNNDALAALGSWLGVTAMCFLWSAGVFSRFRTFHPGGVEGSIDIKMFIIGMSLSFPAIWLLLRSTRRLAIAFAISLLIIVVPSYVGAIHFIYAG